MVKNLHAGVGDMDSIPGLERCHMPQDNYPCKLQLSPHAAATKDHVPRGYGLQQEKPLQ